MLDKNSTFIKHWIQNSGYRLFYTLLTLISGILISRQIFEDGRGEYNLFLTSLVLINYVTNLGFNSSSMLVANQHPEQLQRFFSFNILLSIGSFILVALALSFMPNAFNIIKIELLILFAVIYLVYCINNNLRAMLLGHDSLMYSNKLDLIIKASSTVVILLLYLLDQITIYIGLIIIGCEYLTFNIFGLYHLKISKLDFNFDFKFFRSIILFNFKSYFYTVLTISLLRIDQYFVKAYLGKHLLGIYSQCGTVVENIQIFSTMASAMYVSKFLAQKDYNQSLAQARKILISVAGLYIVIVAIFYIIAPWIVQLYFKNQNPISISTLRYALLGAIPWALYTVLSSLMTGVRIKKSNLIILLSVLIFNVGLNYWITPRYGIIGTAIISGISYLLVFGLSYFDMFYLKRRNYHKRLQANSLNRSDE